MYTLYCAGYAGMLCDLDKTADRTCILQSPWTADGFSWTCMLITYQLSSYDMKVTLDLLVGGVSNASYTLLANESALWISNPDLNSPIIQHQGTWCQLKITSSPSCLRSPSYRVLIPPVSVSAKPCAMQNN